jgi:hypothetical protein
MATDPDQPGLGGLLRGEAEDRMTIALARLAVMIAILGAPALAFAAMSAGLRGRH